MLSRIDNVLTKDEIARIYAVFESVDFVSGKATAQEFAENVKDNLQLPTDNLMYRASRSLSWMR